jgi:hypothetical protein
VAGVSGTGTPGGPGTGHADLGPELRQLAQTILDRIDPAIRGAAAMAAARSGSVPGKCQQIWCPVCALAALVTGEEHPLLTIVGEHSVALLTVIRMMVDGSAAAPQPPEPPKGPDGGATMNQPEPPAGQTTGAGRYQPITITVEKSDRQESDHHE